MISLGVEPGHRSGSPGDGLCSPGCELAESLSSNYRECGTIAYLLE